MHIGFELRPKNGRGALFVILRPDHNTFVKVVIVQRSLASASCVLPRPIAGTDIGMRAAKKYGAMTGRTAEAFMKRIVSLDKSASAILTALDGGVPTNRRYSQRIAVGIERVHMSKSLPLPLLAKLQSAEGKGYSLLHSPNDARLV